MNTSMEISLAHAKLKLAGRFDMDSSHLFRGAYRKLLADCTQRNVVVDMAGVTYMDSTALGMLLLLHREAQEQQITISVEHCAPFIVDILRIAHFDRLFSIST